MKTNRDKVLAALAALLLVAAVLFAFRGYLFSGTTGPSREAQSGNSQLTETISEAQKNAPPPPPPDPNPPEPGSGKRSSTGAG